MGRDKGAPHETLFWWMGSDYALRKGNWKLTREQGEPQLFDLASDIGEEHNLAAEQPEKLEELETLYAEWSSQMGEPIS